MAREIEIKFSVEDLRALRRKLRAAGFQRKTKRTHEMNTLYDLPGGILRARKELLRLRSYGSSWKITHKSGGKTSRYSSRVERETSVGDGKTMDAILRALGYRPSFRYEKFREEWSDGQGQIVVDHTPIGDFCEIEGRPRWIDASAKKLGVGRGEYITKNYATLFADWKNENQSEAAEMTFRTIRNSG